MSESKIVRYSTEELKRMPDESNWEASGAMTDEEIDAAVAADPDEAGLDDDWMERAVVVVTINGKEVSRRQGSKIDYSNIE